MTLDYQWVSVSDDVFGKRPRFETYDTQVKDVATRNLTVWNAAAAVEQQNLSAGGRSSAAGAMLPFGGFDEPSILAAGNVTINAGRDVTIRAIAETQAGVMTIHADEDVQVDGLVPSGATNPLTLPAVAELRAPQQIAITADGTATVTEWSVVETTGASSEIEVASVGTATVSAEVNAGSTIRVQSDGNVALDGPLSAGDLVQILAGQGATKSGNVTGASYADLQATRDDGVVRVSAGEDAGQIDMLLSLLTAAGQVELNALSGDVANDQGLITTPLLIARAESGFDGIVAGGSVDVELSGSGDIQVDSAGAVTLRNLTAADGEINVQAIGAIDAEKVAALGTSDDNAITLQTYAVGDSQSDLTVGDVSVQGLGDVSLIADGNVLLAPGVITADSLTVDSRNAVSLTTNVNRVAVRTREAGDVSIAQEGTRTLRVDDTIVLDGSLTVNHARGNVVLEDVVLASNRVTTTVHVTADGDIEVGSLNAGLYFPNAGDVPSEFGADPELTSLGQVTLTVGGQVREYGEDAAVDLVAGKLSIAAQEGISGLEIAVNELVDVNTSVGSIELHDLDGAGELSPGLIVTAAQAPAGSVSIAADDYLEIHQVIATGENGTARLQSVNGNLAVVRPVSGSAIEVSSGIVLLAGQALESYTFFQAPQWIEYRAGDYFDFNSDPAFTGIGDAAADDLGLPAEINAATVILDRGAGLIIDEPLTVNAGRLELLSDANVFVSSELSGTIGELAITARGTRDVYAQSYDLVTGQLQWSTQLSGKINVQADQIAGDRWEFRAEREVYVELANSFDVVGFVGGLSGFEPVTSAWLVTPATVGIQGGIVSATTARIQAGTVDSSTASVVLADRLEVTSGGGITLSTASDEIVAESTGVGDIVINEADAVTLESVIAADGFVTVTAGGDITAHRVITTTDGVGQDVNLYSNGDIFVNYIDAGAGAGAQRAASQVTLDAFGTIREPEGFVDNEPGENVTMVDVYAWRIHFRHGEPMPAPKLITNETDRGVTDELEIIYTDGTLGTTDGDTTMTGGGVPDHVDGDYILVAPNYTGPLDLTVTGTLVVITLPTTAGQDISLSAGHDLTIIQELNVGDGAVMLNSGGAVTVVETVTANTFCVTGATFNAPLNTDVATFCFHVTGDGGGIEVNEADDVILTASSLTGADAAVTAGGVLTVSEAITGGRNIGLATTSGNLLVNAGLSGTGGVTLTGGGAGSDIEINAVVAGGSLPTTVTSQNDVVFSADGRVTSGTGDVTIIADAQAGRQGGQITMTNGSLVHAGSGRVQMIADGDVRLSSVVTNNATGSAMLIQSDSGGIVDGGDDSGFDLVANEDGAVVTIRTAAGVGVGNPIETQIAALDLINDGLGDVQIVEVDDLSLPRVQQTDQNGAVQIEAAGTITVPAGQRGVSTVDGALQMTAGLNLAVDSLVITSAGQMDLEADDNFLMGSGGRLTSTTGDVRVTADPGSTAAGGSLTMADGALINSGSGLIDLDASCDVTITGLITTNESQVISRYCRILDGGDSDPEILTPRSVLRAALGIGPDGHERGRLETLTNGAVLTLAGVTQQGDFQVHNHGPMVIGTVDGEVGVRISASGSADDHIVFTAASPLTISSPVQNLAGGDIVQAALGNTAADSLAVNANVTASGGDGNIWLYAGGDLTTNTSAEISATGSGDILLAAGTDFNSGADRNGYEDANLTMGDGSQILSGSGDIILLAPEDITLSRLISTSGSVAVVADYEGIADAPIDQAESNTFRDGSGQIIDGTAAEVAGSYHVVAPSVLLRAGDGIGSGLAGDAADIDLQVDTVAGETDSGHINLHSTGALAIGTFSAVTIDLPPDEPSPGNTAPTTLTVSQLAGVTILDDNGAGGDGQDSGNDHITIRASSPLTVSSAVVNDDGGNITLAAEGDLPTDDLTVNASVTAAGGSGSIWLYAGGDFVTNATALVSAAGAGDVFVAAGTDFAGGADNNGYEDGTVAMGDGSQITSVSGDIVILAPEDMTLSRLSTTGNVAVTADWEGIEGAPVDGSPANALRDGSGRIIDGTAGEGANLVAANLLLRAANGVGDGAAGDTDIDLQVSLVAATTDSGDINLQNDGDLTIGTFSSLTIALAPDVSLTAPTSLIISQLAGAAVVDPHNDNSGADTLTIRTSGAMTVNAAVTNNDAANLVLAAEGTNTADELIIRAAITTAGGGGDIGLYAGGDIWQDSGLVFASGAGNVTVSAGENYDGGGLDGGNAAADVTMDSGQTIMSGSGDILIQATRDVALSMVVTANGGDVTVSADDDDHSLANGTGQITDNLTSSEAANVSADVGTFYAATGMGHGGGADVDIETNVTTLVAVNDGATGDIQINETAAGLHINVNQLAQTNAGGSGSILLTTQDGDITVVGGQSGVTVAGTGDARLEAKLLTAALETSTPRGNVVVNAVITTASGDIVLNADHDITGDENGDITSGGAGNIAITSDTNSSGFGSNHDGTIQLDGSLVANTGTLTFSLPDCDGYVGADLSLTTGIGSDTTGNITSAAVVVKNGSGALRLNGTGNNYSGITTVNAGALIVNGQMSDGGLITVGNGALLGGNGTIGQNGGGRDISITAGGILDPGDVANADCTHAYPGQLIVNGDIAFDPSGNFRVQLNNLIAGVDGNPYADGGYDQLDARGFVNLGGDDFGDSNAGAILVADTTAGLPVGAEFNILLNDVTDPSDINTRFRDPNSSSVYATLKEGEFFLTGGSHSNLMNISYYTNSDDNDITLTHPGRFDFNASPVVTQLNYEPVTDAGWSTATGFYVPFATMSGASENRPFAAGTYTPLSAIRDLHATGKDQTASFVVDVVAGQSYQVTILSGDFYWPHDSSEFDIRVNGTPLGTPLTGSTGRGQFETLVFESIEVPGTGTAQLAIDMTYTGDKSGWHAVINALDIRPVTSVGGITMVRTSDGDDAVPDNDGSTPTLPADNLITDTYQGTGAPPNALITIGATNGRLTTLSGGDEDAFLTNLLSRDTGPATDGRFLTTVQVRSNDAGEFQFRLQRPLAVGDVTIEAIESSGLSQGTFVQEFTLSDDGDVEVNGLIRRFDFGSGASPVATGFIGVTPADQWDANVGYGWNATGLGANYHANAALTSEMMRDYVYGNTATFTFAADPGETYDVRIYMADTVYSHDDIDVTFGSIDGSEAYNVSNTTPPFYHEGAGGSPLDRNLTGTRLSSITNDNDGLITITFTDAGGRDPNFVVNGIEIWSASMTDPTIVAYPMRAAGGSATTFTGVPLTQSDLAGIVAEAKSQWTALGLTAEQAQAFDRLEFTVTNLGGDRLALADAGGGISVLVDDDAAGHGWFIDATPWEDGEYTSGGEPPAGIDLLTVVLHELGHMLGLEDVSAAEHPEAVMAIELMEGQMRRLTGGPLLAAQNADDPLDVDANGEVTPLDVLRLINHVNAHGTSLWNPRMGGSPLFGDVTADGVVSAADVLKLINFLNVEKYTKISGAIRTPEAESSGTDELLTAFAETAPVIAPVGNSPVGTSVSPLPSGERDAAILDLVNNQADPFADEWEFILDDIAADIGAA